MAFMILLQPLYELEVPFVRPASGFLTEQIDRSSLLRLDPMTCVVMSASEGARTALL